MAEYPDSLSDLNFPVSLRGMVCRLHGRDVTIKGERFNLRDTPEELLAARAMQRASIARACQRVNDMPKATSTGEAAVYVIEPQSGVASKVGVSTNPLVRLSTLQGGSYEPMTIRALFWLPEAHAYGVEKICLRVVAKMGLRLSGEWCDMHASDLIATIACVLKSNEATQVGCSEMHCNNITALYAKDQEKQESLAFTFGQNPEKLLMRKNA
jgi:hypothetical protein